MCGQRCVGKVRQPRKVNDRGAKTHKSSLRLFTLRSVFSCRTSVKGNLLSRMWESAIFHRPALFFERVAVFASSLTLRHTGA